MPLGSLNIDVSVGYCTRAVACIVAYMLAWAVFYVFRYAGVPQPVNRCVGKASGVIAESISAHRRCCVVKTRLHY